ncbi:hypothetical protein BBK82_41800 [Lentzea guizhouensis]|uniref:Uncharacterized protein n=1 Tax=Lentzea guizhouensis TaxID=1586287 RepID=A0A1B2HUX2_9PSEU|nr:hypothetical protein BBK82_41800 [Lentzea guizhouensis]
MHDQVLVPQVLDPQPAAAREPVVLRQRDDQAVAADGGEPDRRVLDRWSQQRQVDPAGQQGLDLVGGEHLAAEGEVDLRQLLAQGAGEGGQQAVGRGPHAADHQTALQPGGDPAGLGRRVVHGGQHGAGAVEVDGAGAGELDLAGGAVQQGHAELGLQLLDLLGQRRLGHVQAFGGAAEVPFLGDGDEVAQVAEFHGIDTCRVSVGAKCVFPDIGKRI